MTFLNFPNYDWLKRKQLINYIIPKQPIRYDNIIEDYKKGPGPVTRSGPELDQKWAGSGPKGAISLTPAILCATVCYSDNIDSITLIFCEDNPDANLITKN